MDALLIIFFLLGIAMLAVSIRDFSFNVVKKLEHPQAVVVLPITEKNTDAEMLIRDMVKSIESSRISLREVIILDSGMTEEIRKICEKMCAEYPILKIASNEELCMLFYNY